jgi:hypothetical protein
MNPGAREQGWQEEVVVLAEEQLVWVLVQQQQEQRMGMGVGFSSSSSRELCCCRVHRQWHLH